MTATPQRKRTLAIAAGLALLVVAVYSSIGGNEFVDFDDGAYVYENEMVRRGLTLDGLRWAFETAHSANWHPLTWLSHMLDVQWFGVDAGAHHWISVLLHAANTVLLFVFLREATGATWRSAFVAAAFGVHPLHVESVAWIAERKDVLSTLFLLLACIGYVRYVRAPSPARYLLVVASFALGLLAKPMVVTLPALFVLLDVWPLRRWKLGEPRGKAFYSALLDKLPLFALSIASSVVTVIAQEGSGATGSLEAYPFGARVANAVVAYGEYLRKTVWPSDLACFYPHPSTIGESHSPLAIGLSATVLVAVTLLAVRTLRSRPYLALGWFWYLGTLVPVIGLVQVGSQAFADRYTYVPLIGVFVAIVWGAHDLFAGRANARPLLATVAAVLLAACSVVSWNQVDTWRDGDTLYRSAIDATERNWLAWNNLGNQHLRRAERGLADEQQTVAALERALECFEAARRARPDYAEAWYNAGEVHMRLFERERAVECYRRATELDETHADAWSGLGVAYLNLGRYDDAIGACDQALALDPQHVAALTNLSFAAGLKGDSERLEAALGRLRALDPAREAEVRAQLSSRK